MPVKKKKVDSEESISNFTVIECEILKPCCTGQDAQHPEFFFFLKCHKLQNK